MTRKVSMSEKMALTLLQYRRRAIESGLKYEFRPAWQKIWSSLNLRPLPPDDNPNTFGELRYTTPHPPRHRVCIACVLPLAVHFAIYDQPTEKADTFLTLVTVVRVDLMFD